MNDLFAGWVAAGNAYNFLAVDQQNLVCMVTMYYSIKLWINL